MPPRRTTSRKTGQQSTLSFSNSRVTKPTATAPGKQIKETTTTTKTSHVVPVASKSPEPPVADIVPEKEPERQTDELDEPQTDEDRKALNVTEAAIRKYWNEEERGRSAPRVHQKDLDVDEKILRHFDLSTQYGPCIGISRIRRWRRAHMLDLNPPIEVLAVLLKERKSKVNERAYVDELLS